MNNCGGLVESSSPLSTRPGWVRQVNGMAVGMRVDVAVGAMVAVGGLSVGVGIGWFDEEQAESPRKSERIRITRR